MRDRRRKPDEPFNPFAANANQVRQKKRNERTQTRPRTQTRQFKKMQEDARRRLGLSGARKVENLPDLERRIAKLKEDLVFKRFPKPSSLKQSRRNALLNRHHDSLENARKHTLRSPEIQSTVSSALDESIQSLFEDSANEPEKSSSSIHNEEIETLQLEKADLEKKMSNKKNKGKNYFRKEIKKIDKRIEQLRND